MELIDTIGSEGCKVKGLDESAGCKVQLTQDFYHEATGDLALQPL